MMYLNSFNPDAFLCDKAKELRSSIGTFIHKVDVGHKLMPSSLYKKKDNHRNCMKEAMKWKESFSQLLSSKEGLSAFRTFLKTEFSEENLEFWAACEDYKKTPSANKLPAKAQCIFQEFLQIGAPREVRNRAVCSIMRAKISILQPRAKYPGKKSPPYGTRTIY
ncbi:hypothetical protein GDO78_009170 [Eleutherodactylus coqui]|uniref:RGS domain-containing protein n=1 Tax=Eleutherodactylus coqui TaxID=57060 RepID=A0A8J6K7W4_ELECQ|nr:hypothetical protein GDO78_009170 [Eleutherodactylus coqui]